MRRAFVTLPDGIWKIIDKELKGKIGDGDSEVIRNVMIAYLGEKGYILSTKEKERHVEPPKALRDEIEMQDTMLSSLVEVLEEKGQLSYSEYENRIKKKIAEATSQNTRKPSSRVEK